ncbi:TetR/AcrR family transcriptional regulator [Streptomyces sp. NPDC048420]|uniref:TetR/AcrR family transcriptional regulator n=1 Tax=Streptomyces sp. NPDC048420 TaxID=3155755 RepID=UPI003429617B
MTTRTALVEATAELLWERGYTGTSPAMIQKRAGVGQGSMYHHFSGKVNLAVAAMHHSAGTLRETVEEALSTGQSAVERIRAYLETERDPLAGCRVGRLVQDPEVVVDDTLRAPSGEFFAWLTERIAQVLEEGVARGELRQDTDSRTTASLLVAAVQGGYVLARARRDPQVFRHCVAGALRAVEALRAAPAPSRSPED